MNTTLLAHQEEAVVAHAAADWLRRLQRVDFSERAAFLAWLRQSPLHVRELLLALAMDEALDGMDAKKRIDLEGLIASVSNKGLPLHADVPDHAVIRKRFAPRWAAVAIAAVLAVVSVSLYWSPLAFFTRGDTYITKLGEQRGVPLQDGSVIYLNTESRVREEYSKTARDVYLLEGQAIFQVKHDANRPFRVHTNNAVVQAIGTKFDVRRLDGSTEVGVIEGVVKIGTSNPSPQVAAESEAAAPQKLVAGQAITIDAASGRVSAPQTLDVADIAAWQQRRLVFRKEALATIAAEFNRYNRVAIRIEDATVGARRFSGTFQADDPALLIGFLERDPTLVIQRQPEAIVITARRGLN